MHSRYYIDRNSPTTNIIFTALLSLSLVVLAIGWQALKAALMNPVDSIRSE